MVPYCHHDEVQIVSLAPTAFPALPLVLSPVPPMPQVLGHSTLPHFPNIRAQSQPQAFVRVVLSIQNIFLLHSLPVQLLLILQGHTQVLPLPGSTP